MVANDGLAHVRCKKSAGIFCGSEAPWVVDYGEGPFIERQENPTFVRFSTVIHPQGSPETLRDPKGFSLKVYTEEGSWDVVGNNLNVFFIRDAIQFPDKARRFLL